MKLDDINVNEHYDKEISLLQAKKLIFAGKAILTFLSVATDIRYTYKIIKPKLTKNRKWSDEEYEKEYSKLPYFVLQLFGPNNNSNYKYIGTIFTDNLSTIRLTKNSKVNATAIGYIAFQHCLTRIIENNPSSNLKIYHAGYCCRCGRLLTVPESIINGIGPECSKFSKLRESFLKF